MSPQAIAHIRKTDCEPQYLDEHLFGVANLARSFATKIGCGFAGELQGLVHDLGKYGDHFASYLRSAAGLLEPDADDYVNPATNKGRIDHSTAGAQLVWRALSTHSEEAKAAAQVMALNIASHHSGMVDCISSMDGKPPENNFIKRMNKPIHETHLMEVERSADAAVLDRIHQILETPAVVDEIIELLERIRRHNPPGTTRHMQFGLAARFMFSCLIDADRIDSADFERGHTSSRRPMGDYVPWAVLVDRLEKHLAALPNDPGSEFINGHRRAVADWCQQAGVQRKPGIYTLTVPTGGGKTLASLRFALHQAHERALDRIIYIIPYTSVIDQNASVARDVLEPDDCPEDKGKVVLEHHSNLTPERQTWREMLLSENWDAPVVFTTTVQFLEALFGGGTRGARRMHQLANAVLIFDEVQTLPIKCVHLFNNAINFLAEQCNSTILFCSATQPLLDRVDVKKGAARLAPDAELMPDVTNLFSTLRRVRVHYGRKERTHAQIARMAAEHMRRDGSCLVIVNTKSSARELHQLCADLVPQECLFHLSTDMCPAHRAQRLGLKGSTTSDEATILGRLRRALPTLCISTQVMEAGIDVDFGFVIRFLAGADSIAQAAGRCNRHARRRDRHGRLLNGRVFVVRPDRENLGHLEEIRKGQEVARRIFDEFGENPAHFGFDLIGPEAIDAYYQYYFFERREDMTYPLDSSGAERLGRSGETLLNLLSANFGAVHDLGSSARTLFLRQSFMAAGSIFRAIDAPTEGVVVPFGPEGHRLIDQLRDAGNDLKLLNRLVRDAQRYTVNVYPHALVRLTDAKAVRTISAVTRIHVVIDDRYYSPRLGLNSELDED